MQQNEIDRLEAVYGYSLPSIVTFKNIFNEIQCGRSSAFLWAKLQCPGNSYHKGQRDNGPQSCFSRPEIEGLQEGWDIRHLKRPHGLGPAWNFGHEKAVGAMGAAFVQFIKQVQPWKHFRAVLDDD